MPEADEDSRIAAVVLAAGAATRFGGPKQELLLPHVLRRLDGARLEEIVVVLGAHRFPVEGARTVLCPDWAKGPGGSLGCGLAALGPEIDAAVVLLADGPFVEPRAIDRVAAAWRAGAGDVVAASYGGARGHPVVLGRSAWGSIPSDGGRALDPVLVPCDDLGAPGDVDTLEDLGTIEERL